MKPFELRIGKEVWCIKPTREECCIDDEAWRPWLGKIVEATAEMELIKEDDEYVVERCDTCHWVSPTLVCCLAEDLYRTKRDALSAYTEAKLAEIRQHERKIIGLREDYFRAVEEYNREITILEDPLAIKDSLIPQPKTDQKSSPKKGEEDGRKSDA